MLDSNTLETLKEYTKMMLHAVEIRLFRGDHPKRQELISMLEQVVSVSTQLSFVERDEGQLATRLNARPSASNRYSACDGNRTST